MLLDLVSGTGYEGVPRGPEPLNSQISFQGRKAGSCENLGNQNLRTGQNREGGLEVSEDLLFSEGRTYVLPTKKTKLLRGESLSFSFIHAAQNFSTKSNVLPSGQRGGALWPASFYHFTWNAQPTPAGGFTGGGGRAGEELEQSVPRAGQGGTCLARFGKRPTRNTDIRASSSGVQNCTGEAQETQGHGGTEAQAVRTSQTELPLGTRWGRTDTQTER